MTRCLSHWSLLPLQQRTTTTAALPPNPSVASVASVASAAPSATTTTTTIDARSDSGAAAIEQLTPLLPLLAASTSLDDNDDASSMGGLPTDDDDTATWSPSALEYLDDAALVSMDVDSDDLYPLPFDIVVPLDDDDDDAVPVESPVTRKRPSPVTYVQQQQVQTRQIGQWEPTAVAAIDQHQQPPRRQRRALVWLRRDLRTHDNLALQAALDTSDVIEIIPIYIIHRPVKKRCGAVRFQFLLECVADLSNNLETRQSGLVVLRGEASEVFKVIFPAWGITDLYFEAAEVAFGVQRDAAVCAIAHHFGVQTTAIRGQTLFDPRAVVALNNGVAPTDFETFLSIVTQLPRPPVPQSAPDVVRGWHQSKTTLYDALDVYCHTYLHFSGAVIAGTRDAPFAIPGLDAFGHRPPRTHSFLYGGERIALERFAAFCAQEERVGLFQKPKTSPVCLEKPSTTALSAYVAFGCLSIREFYHRVQRIQRHFDRSVQGSAAVTLDGQLLWREFFYCYAAATPHFDTQDLNPLCKQINWKLQHVPLPDTVWTDDTKAAMEQLQCWMTGRTGFPWIDAVMRQIEVDGWAHHVARHAVACFLTRGDLYISWLRGASFFQEKLIDLDWPLNIGNWLWVSSSCFFADYTAVHSPSMFIQQWDPQGKYIRKYIPELKKMPARYIFEPWSAPLSVQRTAGCLIGKDYPFPIVDHKIALKRCMAGMKVAYEDIAERTDATRSRSGTETSGGSGQQSSRDSSSKRPRESMDTSDYDALYF